MNVDERSRNDAAIRRIECDIAKLSLTLRVQRIIAIFILLTVIICGLTCVCTLRDIGIMQTDTLNQLMYIRQDIDDLRPVEQEPVSLGKFKISHYCPCSECCGKSDGITYTGTVATANRTIGVDPEVIPLGSTVFIDGQAYIAEDIGGGIKGNHIDVFVDNHEEALDLGIKYKEVFTPCIFARVINV